MYLIISQVLIIIAFIFGFYLGKNHSLKLRDNIQKIKEILPKRYGKVVIDIDEAEIERRGIKSEPEIIDIKDALKFNENAQNN